MPFLIRLFISLLCGVWGYSHAVDSHAVDIHSKTLNHFVQSQQQLNQQIELECQSAKSTVTSLQTLKQTLTQAQSSWIALKAMQLPAANFLQTDYLFVYWPDSKDLLKKQINHYIKQSPTAVTADTLPAAVTSLSALEYLLNQAQPNQHCAWLTFISAFQVEHAEQLRDLQAFYDFGMAEEFIALQGTSLTLESILKPLLSRDQKIQWVLAPGWRSHSGSAIIHTLRDQLRQLIAQFQSDHPDINPWLARLDALPSIEESSTYNEVYPWLQTLSKLAEFINYELAAALELPFGFNNFDGD